MERQGAAVLVLYRGDLGLLADRVTAIGAQFTLRF